MASKMVSLDTEAYGLLKGKKRPGESFSDVVKRVAAPRRPLSDFIGIWKDMPKDELEEVKEFIKEGRRLDVERQNRLVRRS
jgi:predicted CopG family antitoxin